MTHVATVTRRTVLKSAAASLVVGFTLLPSGRRAAATAATLAPNAFVRIDADSTVTVISKHLEMGQGTYTGLAMVLAEELDADWSKIKVESAPVNTELYANALMGMQGTGGSSGIANSYEQLRKAGATARAMLVEAAAQEWNVPASEITIRGGIIAHAADRTAQFGELVARAANVTPPPEVKLKDPKSFQLIGKPVPRLDSAMKSDGSAVYGADVKLPGLLTALVARPPRFGGVVKTADDTAAKVIPGVKYVVTISSGVAVVAESFWAASRGRNALKIDWDEKNAERRGTAELLAEYKELASKPGLPARQDGDVVAALKSAARTIDLDFDVPYLAHAPMEPLNCVIRRRDDSCELWYGCQNQTSAQAKVANVLSLPLDKVKINTLMAGGSFGRRGNAVSDYAVEAAEIAKALPVGTPIKTVWTREDDVRGGYYRPMYYHRLRAGLDDDGNITSWSHRIVGQSIMKGSPFESAIANGIDFTSVEVAATMVYQIPNLSVELHSPEVGIPVLWWRSVGASYNGFVVEGFLDHVARAAKRDPLELRRELVPKDSRHRKVLDLISEKSDWSSPLPDGHARGVAIVESFGSVVANVAEVSKNADGRIKIERFVCAVDCGTAVNPALVASQMEGGIAFGLSAALKGKITLKDGIVEQGNFDTYDVLRLAEMPPVEVHILPSDAAPSGVGEPGVPPVAPALTNAILALTGQTLTSLPLAPAIDI